MTDTVVGWRNRIIGQEDVDPKVLKANPKNWRKHPKQQQEVLTGVLDEVGWVDQVLVNKRTGLMIDGHLRVELALKRREPMIPVTYVDLSEQEEALILATFDPISAMASRSVDTLRELIGGLSPQSDAVSRLLGELAMVDNEKGGALAVANFRFDAPKTHVEYGDVWDLSEHILVVRDVFTEWKHWIKYLESDRILLLYPGPFVAMQDLAQRPLLLVQPSIPFAAYTLDRWVEQKGESTMRKRM